MRVNDTEKTESKAFVSKSQYKGKGAKQGMNKNNSNNMSKPKGDCFVCDKPGHWARNCRFRKYINKSDKNDTSKERDTTQGTASVSYTHLDVYKRQPF